MIRHTVIQNIKPIIRQPLSIPRTLSNTAIRKAEGDTGAPRSGGAAQRYLYPYTQGPSAAP